MFSSTLSLIMVSASVVAGQVGLAAQGSALPIIPQPVRVERADGVFVIDENTTIVADAASMAEARKLQDCLAPAMGFRLKLVEENTQSQGGAITLKTNDGFGGLSDEGYSLSVAPDGILIGAKARPGLFYGIQTLRQLLPPAVFRLARVEGVRWEVPCVRIEDQPRFKWRGLLVDTARHFVPKSSLLKFIDTMALHKFNSLQLHLTDDQGWRIEIKKYPKLTEIGAWRDETLVGHISAAPWQFDGRKHGGFYTQDDIREIVRYAADRHINVVPEIEMPGHARAAISAYPHLGCNPDAPLKPWTIWGVCPDIFCPTDQTVAFLQDVLSEVMELFPGPYIHIGGDEAVKDQWKASPVVQARIKALGLRDEAEMQSWFIKQMDTFLTKQGRRLVGWDEILEGGLAPGAVVMSWRGEKGGITAAKSGHDVVMTPVEDTYLNLYQGSKDQEPLSFVGDLPLRKVYVYEPIPADLSEEGARRVLGTQGQLWSEYIPNPRQLEYMAYPRAAALAEVAWSAKDQRDYESFLGRLRQHVQRLQVIDVGFRRLDE